MLGETKASYVFRRSDQDDGASPLVCFLSQQGCCGFTNGGNEAVQCAQ